MCGIAGSFGPFQPALQPALDALAHRGPDDAGQWTDPAGRLQLGHRRLSIIDLSADARQPMLDHEARCAVVFNGEIYNYIELRAELETLGSRFRTRSDTEVILEAYKRWGESALARFDGMFAFALWDAGQRQLLLARDPCGEKCLYYTTFRDTFLFASEPKALFALGVPAAFDTGTMPDYFVFRSVPAPRTPFAGISKLEAGHALVVREAATPRRIRYSASACTAPSDSISDPGKAADEFLNRLRESVRLRLRSDVPVGAFLSGGVDSSLVTALAAQLNPGPHRLRTFSVGVEDERMDERPYQRRVSGQYGTEHIGIVVRENDLIESLDDWLRFCDDLVADPSAMALHLLSKKVREHDVKVVLSGEGADELFAGYGSYRAALRPRPRVPRWIGRRLLRSRSPALRSAGWAALEMLPFSGTAAAAGESALPLILDTPGPTTAAQHWRGRTRAGLRDLLDFDITYRLPDDILMRTDRATMSASIESRVPFLAPALIRWAAGLPDDLLVRNSEDKFLVKKAAERLLPRELIYRPKVGFDLPVAHWLRGRMRDRAQSYLADRSTPGLRYDTFSRIWSRPVWNTRETALLWRWFSLEAWHRVWFP